MPHKYASSVLSYNVEDHDCAVCQFLTGSRKVEDLLEVIRVLDSTLGTLEVDYNSIMLRIADYKLRSVKFEGIDPKDLENLY